MQVNIPQIPVDEKEDHSLWNNWKGKEDWLLTTGKINTIDSAIWENYHGMSLVKTIKKNTVIVTLITLNLWLNHIYCL